LLNSKVILKYILIHLAEIAALVLVLLMIRYFVYVSTWIIVVIIVLWVIKDIALFPKVWRAYAFDDNSPMRKLIGSEAIVVDSVNPAGHVRVRGELWKAEVRDRRYPAERGDRTRVVDIQGMTLIVERWDEPSAPPIS
jgi:membrane-bound ClpP family serine protease